MSDRRRCKKPTRKVNDSRPPTKPACRLPRIANADDDDDDQAPITGLPANSPPLWSRLPLDHKLPMVPGSKEHVVLSRGKILKPLHLTSKDFDLWDPYNVVGCNREYEPLHDPHTANFLRWTDHYRVVERQHLVTPDGEVPCSLQQFNDYRRYLNQLKTIESDNEFRKELEKMQTLRTERETSRREKLAAERERGGSVAYAQKARERKEALLQKFKLKFVQKQQEMEDRLQTRLLEKSLKKLELEAQKIKERRSKLYTTRGRQRLDIWLRLKRIQEMETEERIRIRKLEERKERERRRRQEEVEQRWVERWERQTNQMSKEDAKVRHEVEVFRVKLAERRRKLEAIWKRNQDQRRWMTKHKSELGDEEAFNVLVNQADQIQTPVKTQFQFYTPEKLYLPPGSSSEMSFAFTSTEPEPDCAEVTVQSFIRHKDTNVYVRCHGSVSDPESLLNDVLEGADGMSSTVETVSDYLVTWVEKSANAEFLDVADVVWMALREIVLDAIQMRMQRLISSRGTCRLPDGSNEHLVSYIVEKVVQKTLQEGFNQLFAIFKNLSMPSEDDIKALVDNISDLVEVSTTELLLNDIQGSNEQIHALWQECVLRAASEIGRQVHIHLILWLRSHTTIVQMPIENADTLFVSCTLAVNAIVMCMSRVAIVQSIFKNRPVSFSNIVSFCDVVVEKTISLAESCLWQKLCLEKTLPTNDDIQQMAVGITRTAFVQTQQFICSEYVGESEEFLIDLLLDGISHGIQMHILLHSSKSSNKHGSQRSTSRPILTIVSDLIKYAENSKDNLSAKQTAEFLSAKVVGETQNLSSTLCHDAVLFKEMMDPITLVPLQEALAANILEAVSRFIVPLQQLLIPSAAKLEQIGHSIAQQTADRCASHIATDPGLHSGDDVDLSRPELSLLEMVLYEILKEKKIQNRKMLRMLVNTYDMTTAICTVKQAVRFSIQLELLSIVNRYLAQIVDEGRKRTIQLQVEKSNLQHHEMHTVISKGKAWLTTDILHRIQFHTANMLSLGTVPSQTEVEKVIQNTVSMVIPHAVSKMENRLQDLLASIHKDAPEPELYNVVQMAIVTAYTSLRLEAMKEETAQQKSGSRTAVLAMVSDYQKELWCKKSGIRLPRSKLNLMQYSKATDTAMQHLKSIVVTLTVSLARDEARRLIDKAIAYGSIPNGAEYHVNMSANSVVNQMLIYTEQKVLHSEYDLIQVWKSPMIEVLLDCAVKFLYNWSTKTQEGDQIDKTNTVKTKEMIRNMLLLFRPCKTDLQSDVRPCKTDLQSDEKHGQHSLSVGNLKKCSSPKSTEQDSDSPNSSEHLSTMRRTLPYSRNSSDCLSMDSKTFQSTFKLVEQMLFGALSAEIFSKEVAPETAFSRAEIFMQHLLIDLMKNEIQKEAGDSLETILQKMVESIVNAIIMVYMGTNETQLLKVVSRYSQKVVCNILNAVLQCAMSTVSRDSSAEQVGVVKRNLVAVMVKAAVAEKEIGNKLQVNESIKSCLDITIQKMLTKIVSIYYKKSNSDFILQSDFYNITTGRQTLSHPNRIYLPPKPHSAVNLHNDGDQFQFKKPSFLSLRTCRTDSVDSSESGFYVTFNSSKTGSTNATYSKHNYFSAPSSLSSSSSNSDEIYFDTRTSVEETSDQSWVTSKTDCTNDDSKAHHTVDMTPNVDTTNCELTPDIVALVDNMVSVVRQLTQFNSQVQKFSQVCSLSQEEIHEMAGEMSRSVTQCTKNCPNLTLPKIQQLPRAPLRDRCVCTYMTEIIIQSLKSVFLLWLDEDIELDEVKSMVDMVGELENSTFDSGTVNEQQVHNLLKNLVDNLAKLVPSGKPRARHLQNNTEHVRVTYNECVVDFIEATIHQTFKLKFVLECATCITDELYRIIRSLIDAALTCQIKASTCSDAKSLPRAVTAYITSHVASGMLSDAVASMEGVCSVNIAATLEKSKASVMDVAIASSKCDANYTRSKTSLKMPAGNCHTTSETLLKSEFGRKQAASSELFEMDSDKVITSLQKSMAVLVQQGIQQIIELQSISESVATLTHKIMAVQSVLSNLSSGALTETATQCVDSRLSRSSVMDEAVLEVLQSATCIEAHGQIASTLLDLPEFSVVSSKEALQLVDNVLNSAALQFQAQEASVHTLTRKIVILACKRLKQMVQRFRKARTKSDQSSSCDKNLPDSSIQKRRSLSLQNSPRRSPKHAATERKPCTSDSSLQHTKLSSTSLKPLQQCIASALVSQVIQESVLELEQNSVSETTKEKRKENTGLWETTANILLSQVVDILEQEVLKQEIVTTSGKGITRKCELAQSPLGKPSKTKLVSAVTTNILKETLEVLVATLRLRSKTHQETNSTDGAIMPCSEVASQICVPGFVLSKEYITAKIVSEIQSKAVVWTEQHMWDSRAYKDSLSDTVLVLLKKIVDYATKSRNPGEELGTVLSQVANNLDDEIHTGHATVRRGRTLPSLPAALTINMICRLQLALMAEVENLNGNDILQEDSSALSEGEVGNTATKASTSGASMADNETSVDEQVWDAALIQKSIMDRLSEKLSREVQQLVVSSWNCFGPSSSHTTVDTSSAAIKERIHQTLNNVINTLKSKPANMDLSAPAAEMFYTPKSSTGVINSILKLLQSHAAQRYRFSGFHKSSDRTGVKTGQRSKGRTECTSSLSSPRHVPILGALAVEASQFRTSKSATPVKAESLVTLGRNTTLPKLITSPRVRHQKPPSSARRESNLVPEEWLSQYIASPGRLGQRNLMPDQKHIHEPVANNGIGYARRPPTAMPSLTPKRPERHLGSSLTNSTTSELVKKVGQLGLSVRRPPLRATARYPTKKPESTTRANEGQAKDSAVEGNLESHPNPFRSENDKE